MARKKKAPEGSPGAPLFMATYGDMVTLLLCFFVLLYSFSTLDVVKFQSLANSMQQALNVMPAGGATAVSAQGIDQGAFGDQSAMSTKPSRDYRTYNAAQVLAQVEKVIQDENLEDKVTAQVTERGIVISFSEQLLFAPGSAQITPVAARVLYKIGQVLKALPNKIAIEGHTDSSQPVGSIYRDNWGLSAARAASVASYMDERVGLEGHNLQAVGYGSKSPIVPNDTPAHQALNRRVDLVILSEHSVR